MKVNVTVRLVLISLAVLIGFPFSQAEASDPNFTASANLMYLTREGNDNHTLVTDSWSGGNELLNSSDLDLGWEPGLDASLAYRIGAFKAEVRYFGLHDWSESHDSGTSPTGAVIWYETQFGNTNFPNDVSADYESKIHSIELNLHWYPIDRLSLLFGCRYFKLDEVFSIYGDVGPGLNLATWENETDNEMLGAQLGVQGDFINICDCFKISGWAKGGYLKNNYSVDIKFNEQVSPTSFSADNGDDKGTFFSEVGINLSYTIFNHVALTASYQFLYIDKVALAHNVITNSDLMNGSASKMTDSVYYHGATAGITIFW